uniref:Uncharacterized protein n=1 Tax=viral metagenome TaxID=1070528 RepID=A0A6H1ZBE3_9ZZZZ
MTYDPYAANAAGEPTDPFVREHAGRAEGWEDRYRDKWGMGGDRYGEQFDAVHAAQLRQAEEMYQAAGQQGTLQAAQMRGQGLQQTLGGLGGGGLEARQALMGAGQASWGAGQEGSRIGSSERLAASEAYMSAQSDRARYDQANAGAWQQRFNIDQQLMRDADAAHRAKVAAEEAAAWQLGGAILGAGSAGLASAGEGPGHPPQGS